MKLKDFLKEKLELGRDDVFKVDCKETFSFFNTESELTPKILAFFTDYKHEGRFVNVEISEDKGRGTSRNKRRSGGSARRSGGGDFKPRGERRSGGSSRRSDSSGNRSERRSEPRSRRSSDASGSNRSDNATSGVIKNKKLSTNALHASSYMMFIDRLFINETIKSKMILAQSWIELQITVTKRPQVHWQSAGRY